MRKGLKGAIGLAAIITVCAFAPIGCAPEAASGEWTVYVPDGAPALALAALMHGDKEDDGYAYRVVDPALITTKVTADSEEDNADFCVLPITAASRLLGTGEEYKLVATVTRGNLYIVSKTETTMEELSVLTGKTVGVLKIDEVPGLTLKATLNRKDVAWQELSEGVSAASDKVNLKGVAGVDGTYEYYLSAEPAVSKQAANGFHVVGDLQALYGEDGYLQAVLAVKRSITEKESESVDEFVRKLESGRAWLLSAEADEIYSAVTSHFEDKDRSPTFTAATLGRETLLRCGISVRRAADAKTEIEEYLREMLTVDANAASMPEAELYYGS